MLPGIAGITGFTSTAAGGGTVTDPHFASTVLLLSGDGTSGSTTFTDLSFAAHGSPSAPGGNNDTQVNTGSKKFGTGSIRFDGSGDYLEYSDHADWNLGSGNFTIETWAAISALSSNLDNENCLIGQWEASGNLRSFLLRYDGSLATNQLQFLASSAGSATNLTVAFNWTPTGDQFYHLCAERSGNDFRLYIDGSMVAKVNQSITFFNSTSGLLIGTRGNAGAQGLLRGNQDEIRITKGVARYASDSGFAVPTAAYPRS